MSLLGTLLAVYFIFAYGLPFIALACLQLRVIHNQPEDKEIDKFLKSLRFPISFIFLGNNKNLLQLIFSPLPGTLYGNLKSIKTHSGLIRWIQISIPFLIGGLFICLPLVLYTASFLFGDDVNSRVGSGMFLVLAILSLYKASRFGSAL